MTLDHDTRLPRIDTTGMRVPEPYPDVDPLDAPPSDAGAECALLAMCLIYPQHLRAITREDLFVFPEHRMILRSMRKVSMRSPDLDVAEFYLALRQEMCAARCPADSDHVHSREQCDGFKVLRVLDFRAPANPKDIVYWLSRLERVRESRQFISDGAEMAERGWCMDTDGARRVAERAAAPRTVQIKDRLLSV